MINNYDRCLEFSFGNIICMMANKLYHTSKFFCHLVNGQRRSAASASNRSLCRSGVGTRLALEGILYMGESLSSITKAELQAATIAAWSLAKDKRKTGGDVARPAPTPKPDNGDRPAEPPAK
jgi:hypothetical protein